MWQLTFKMSRVYFPMSWHRMFCQTRSIKRDAKIKLTAELEQRTWLNIEKWWLQPSNYFASSQVKSKSLSFLLKAQDFAEELRTKENFNLPKKCPTSPWRVLWDSTPPRYSLRPHANTVCATEVNMIPKAVNKFFIMNPRVGNKNKVRNPCYKISYHFW